MTILPRGCRNVSSWSRVILRVALDGAPPGELRVVSMCAGQGRDVIGVLSQHPRRSDVRARLVERDERNVAVALDSASRFERRERGSCLRGRRDNRQLLPRQSRLMSSSYAESSAMSPMTMWRTQ